jgi:hypothetical protein
MGHQLSSPEEAAHWTAGFCATTLKSDPYLLPCACPALHDREAEILESVGAEDIAGDLEAIALLLADLVVDVPTLHREFGEPGLVVGRGVLQILHDAVDDAVLLIWVQQPTTHTVDGWRNDARSGQSL